MEKIRLLRITTVPISLSTLLKGQLNFFSKHNFEVLAVSSAGPEVSQIESEGIKHVAITMTRRITPLRDLWALWKLIWLIRKFKPVIVHTHTPKAGLLGMLAARICGVPVRLHTIAGLAWTESKGVRRDLLKTMERMTYLCATRVYPNSTNLQHFLFYELGFKPIRTKVIGNGSSNGVDIEYFKRTDSLLKETADLRKRFRIQEDEFVFSFVGRVVKAKGIVELAEAFLEICKTKPCRLLVVGEFEQELDPLPESTLEIIKNNPRVVMAGFQQDVRPWLLASDIFVFPSYREGFPNSVLQACCLELPVIATDINGCNEIIQNRESGLIVPVKDVQALKSAMVEIMSKPDLGKAMGIKGREFVSAHFSQQFVWAELLKEYQLYVDTSLPRPK